MLLITCLFCFTISGTPSQIIFPKSRNSNKEQRFIMSFTSCSIIKILVPSLLILSKKFFKSDVSLWFIPAAGSSMTNKLGLVAKALAISNRLWSP